MKTIIEHPSQEYLNEILEYRNGQLFWKVKLSDKVVVGRRAGNKGRFYRIVTINKSKFYEHRLIWIMHNGAIPFGLEIDHENLNKNDNTISNLRLANSSQNKYNRKPKINSVTGFKGVSTGKSGKWVVRIAQEGTVINLGTYFTPEAASMVYQAAAKKFHGEFAQY